MAWPFTSSTAPNLDTGPGAVPLVDTAITGAQAWLLGADFTNVNAFGGATVTLTLTNGAGAILEKKEIPPGGNEPFEWPFRPSLGVRWFADVAGLVGQVWGYT